MKTRLLPAFAAALLLLTACGASSAGDGTDDVGLGGELIAQGEVTVDDSAIPSSTTTTTEAPDEGGAGAAEGDGAQPGFEETGETIPQNEEDDPAAQVNNLFSALRIFNDCLEEEGTTFQGDPRNAEPGSPAADPGYLESLSRCAAISNIAEAFQEFQTTSDNLSQDEILERNEGLVVWADCMEGRGWTIGELVADERGLLSPGQMEGPNGETPLDSDDMQECANTAIDEADIGGDGDAEATE